MLPESRNSASSTGSKTVRSSFLKYPLLWEESRWATFLFGKPKSCMKTYMDFKLDKNLSSELLNMEKTYDFVMKPLKNDPLETTVSIFFFSKLRYSQPK